MAVTVVLNSMTITGTDGNGVHWHVAEVAGWDGFDVRREVLTAPGVAGGIAGEWVKDSLALSIVGSADAPSTSAMLVAIEALMTASTALSADVALSVNRGAGAQTMQVRLAERQLVKILTDRAFTFEIPLIALNPVKT